MMRWRALFLAFMVALMLGACLVPVVSASGPVNIFSVDADDRKIVAGEATSFEWIVYNNDTSPMIVGLFIDPPSIDRADITISPQYATLDPGESQDFIVTIMTHREIGTKEIDITISFNATMMDDPVVTISNEETLHLSVESLYGTAAGNNRIFGIWDNPLPPPFDTTYGAFLVTIIGWIIIAYVIALIISPIIHHFAKKTTTELDDKLLSVIRGPVGVLIILYGLTASLRILNIPPDLQVIIEDSYSIILIVLMTWLAYGIYDSLVMEYVHILSEKSDNPTPDALIPLLEKLGMIIIPFIGLMFIFNLFNYDITVFLASLGILGIVIGFAAQDTLSNFFSGASLLVERPFKVGDLILYGEDICEVHRIGIRSTTLYNTFQSQYFIIPNSLIANDKIVNIVKPNKSYKVKLEVGVAYGSDIELVKRLIMESALEHPEIMKDPSHYPWVRFTEFGDSALTFKLFAWVDDLDVQWRIASDIREKIDAKFRENNVDIPFPQRTVWLNDTTKKE